MSTIRLLSNRAVGRAAFYGVVGRQQQQQQQHCRQLPALTALCTNFQYYNSSRICYTNNNNNSNNTNNTSNNKLQQLHRLVKWPLANANAMVVALQQNVATLCGLQQYSTKSSPSRAGKSEANASTSASASASSIADTHLFGESSNLGLFAKFKLMYKKYWYVLIPVHVVTSAGWLGGFYYLAKSGVDVPALLQYMHLSETIIEKVQGSEMGNIALAYLCYKVATPLRYALTLGGTTVSIKYLVQAGHIKPMPSKKQLIDLYEQKKADRAAAKADKSDKE